MTGGVFLLALSFFFFFFLEASVLDCTCTCFELQPGLVMSSVFIAELGSLDNPDTEALDSAAGCLASALLALEACGSVVACAFCWSTAWWYSIFVVCLLCSSFVLFCPKYLT